MQVSFKQSPQAARATTKSSDVTRMMYASRAVPMAARIAVVVSIEVSDGRSRSALYNGLYGRLERVNFFARACGAQPALSQHGAFARDSNRGHYKKCKKWGVSRPVTPMSPPH